MIRGATFDWRRLAASVSLSAVLLGLSAHPSMGVGAGTVEYGFDTGFSGIFYEGGQSVVVSTLSPQDVRVGVFSTDALEIEAVFGLDLQGLRAVRNDDSVTRATEYAASLGIGAALNRPVGGRAIVYVDAGPGLILVRSGGSAEHQFSAGGGFGMKALLGDSAAVRFFLHVDRLFERTGIFPSAWNPQLGIGLSLFALGHSN